MKIKTLLLLLALTAFSCEKRKISTDIEGIWAATFVERKVFVSGFERENYQVEGNEVNKFMFHENNLGWYYVDTGRAAYHQEDSYYSGNRFIWNYRRPQLELRFTSLVFRRYPFPFELQIDTIPMEVRIEDFENIELTTQRPNATAEDRVEIRIKLKRLSK